MKARIIILFSSALAAIVLIAAGYGLWEERLTIKGRINVIRPQMETQVIPKELPVNTENLTPGAVDIDNTTTGAIDMTGTTTGAISTGAISTDAITEGAITTGGSGTDNVNEGRAGTDNTMDGDIVTDMETGAGAEPNVNTGADINEAIEEVQETENAASIQEQPVIEGPEADNKPEEETKGIPDETVPAQEPTVDTAADPGTAVNPAADPTANPVTAP